MVLCRREVEEEWGKENVWTLEGEVLREVYDDLSRHCSVGWGSSERAEVSRLVYWYLL